mgnify:FL=1
MKTDIHVSKLYCMRDAILEIAEQQLMQGGYDKLNFATIAKELDTTRANLHYHFKNKETLAIEVTRQYAARYIDEFNRLRESFNGNFLGFFETVENMIWLHSGSSDDDKVASCSTLVSDPDLPESIAKLSRENYDKIETAIAGVIQDAIDNNEIRKDIDVKREAARSHVIMMGIGTCGEYLLNLKQAKERFGGMLEDWANSLK